MCQTAPKSKRRSRKRCPFCEELFWPDPRTRGRQWACSKPACQKQRRRESQRRWRAKNPDDAAARRYRREVNEASSDTLRAPRLPTTKCSPFPWGEAKDVISPQLYVTLKHLAYWGFRLMVDERSLQGANFTGEMRNSPLAVVKDEMGPFAPP
jgi:hypothetical protein